MSQKESLGLKPVCPPPQKVATLPLLADLLLRADGSWLLKPVLPSATSADLDTWVKVRDAAKLLRVSKSQVYAWLGVYLVFRRPAHRLVEISLTSLREIKRATNDPEFWDSSVGPAALQRSVEKTMHDLAASSLKEVGTALATVPQFSNRCPNTGKPCSVLAAAYR